MSGYRVDLNCDLGESFGPYRIGMDEKIIPLITSANVACGFHGGDPNVMEKTVALCRKSGVSVGAHPGFHDLEGFGRRNLAASPAEVKNDVIYQIGALSAFCRAQGVKLHHVKPHGALYNMAVKDEGLATAICEGIRAVDENLPILAPGSSAMVRAAKKLGIPVICEVFADRAYMPDGTLVPRKQPGAMIEEENLAVERVLRMVKEGKVQAIDGTDIDVQADSVCVHGDNEKALCFVERIRAALEGAGVEVCSP